ncbi:putative leucine-rich repeat-containing protein DDB_G0290503 isoform X1 [Frieseomelitta varia]|uniref:putative leucine-rich repeat-containing protein DDB_G0290503 isoform X1 n=3 Tax=Frieseomelitta varia TaxID=561572 RepID=UPI001CB67EA8|nr:putative leucine-rich repeat-containing protein DDB_G0290503 isoform X1 [Frieseomelitta varia]
MKDKELLIISGCLNMPGCAAVGCNNRSEKGYIMKCFPRDPKLRKIWQERVARADWEPSNNSFLCHVHFESQEWSITQSGRIRLRKNAIPSIFTVTSNRKSPKKKTKTFDSKGESILQGEYNIEYMEIDTEHSSIEHLEEKDLDFQEIEDSSMQQSIENSFKYTYKSTEAKKEESVKINHQTQNIVMIAEDNLTDINNLVEQYNIEIQPNDNKKKIEVMDKLKTQVSNITMKKEIKLEIMERNAFEDSYDEIEEKLKQICDGGSTEDDNYKNEIQKEDEVEEKTDGKVESTSNDQKVTSSDVSHLSIKNEVGHILAGKEENVEIIFGTESGDEKTSASQNILKVNKVDNNTLKEVEMIYVKDEKKVFNEDIEENFSKDEVHVIPNIRAAMKRKRRTREEIMKSIKKSIRSNSDQDINSSSNTDSSEVQIKNELSLFSSEINDINKNDTKEETAKFVIKITGDSDDVTEIIEELSSNTIGTQISKEFNTFSKIEENDSLVTSIITVLSPKNLKGIIYGDFNNSLIKDDYVTSSKETLIMNQDEDREFTSLNSTHSSKTYHSNIHTCSDEEERLKIRTNSPLQNCTQDVPVTLENNRGCISSDYEDLLERIQIQEGVIAKLTDQIIIYKDLENSIRGKVTGHEIQIKDVETSRINTRSSKTQLFIYKKNIESKQRLIEDLSNRVNYLEETNKKLMKNVTLESQQKRKLEGQIKQKDNRIKELNWKLEKASKYLERAEKNTNTYRRKMLNMQTIIRRRKLLDEKLSKFDMLIDNSKKEKVLSMAIEIRKVCGRIGYDKLISYGFPLPPPQALKEGILTEDFANSNRSDMYEVRNSTQINVKTEKVHDTNNESEIYEKDTELLESVGKATEYESTETVTGTVQDIFDENNDGDDFSTNELREHFILQLNAVM